MPLPHDLRPSRVLSLAMDHLLANVMDRVDTLSGSMAEWYDLVNQGVREPAKALASSQQEENIGEWFEYLWSATRGIRKDLTQQMLKDPLAVALMEKCARLHIVCSERLVEESSHNFDRKLNDENLTKCLQTLKHMYEDLRVEGTRSPNEPEFMAYDVLMNLNDGDTLRTIQNMEPWVRSHPSIKFALKVFMALNSNNYIKFFRLVRQEASLLQGCILLRYFYQV